MLQTAKVTVESTGEGLAVKAGTRGFTITFDEPEEAGGTNQGMNPVEGLLAAFGGCESIFMLLMAKAQGVKLEDVKLEVEGDIDPDGFTGVNPDVRCGLQEARVRMRLKCADEAAARSLAELAEQRCPVGDSLRSPVRVVTTEVVVD